MDDTKVLLTGADKGFKEASAEEDWEGVKQAIKDLDQGLAAIGVLDKAAMDAMKSTERIREEAGYQSYTGTVYSYDPGTYNDFDEPFENQPTQPQKPATPAPSPPAKQ